MSRPRQALGHVEAQQMLPEPGERFHGNAIQFATWNESIRFPTQTGDSW
jgi:hypothetical protein